MRGEEGDEGPEDMDAVEMGETGDKWLGEDETDEGERDAMSYESPIGLGSAGGMGKKDALEDVGVPMVKAREAPKSRSRGARADEAGSKSSLPSSSDHSEESEGREKSIALEMTD